MSAREPFWRKTLGHSNELSTRDTAQSVTMTPPEVVASNEGLEAGAEIGRAEVLTKLNGLINEAVAITEVGRLRRSQVQAETFSGAVNMSGERAHSHDTDVSNYTL